MRPFSNHRAFCPPFDPPRLLLLSSSLLLSPAPRAAAPETQPTRFCLATARAIYRPANGAEEEEEEGSTERERERERKGRNWTGRGDIVSFYLNASRADVSTSAAPVDLNAIRGVDAIEPAAASAVPRRNLLMSDCRASETGIKGVPG